MYSLNNSHPNNDERMTDLITIKEACDTYGISRFTLTRLFNSGDLTRHSIAGDKRRVFLDPKELEALYTPQPST